MHIVWFRDDLRLGDNPALTEAAQRGGAVAPLYIYDTTSTRPLGGASKWFLYHALSGLDAAFREQGGRLNIYSGDPLSIFKGLTESLPIDAVYVNDRYDEEGKKIDSAIEALLAKKGIAFVRHTGSLLHAPGEVVTGSGTAFHVFTPFRNAVGKLEKRAALPVPRLSLGATLLPTVSLDALSLLPKIPWDREFFTEWPVVTERGAREQLEKFLIEKGTTYKRDRDIPSLEATSRLSPFLRFGLISPIQIWHETQAHIRSGAVGREGAEHFLSELCWREFSYNLLAHHPDIATEPLKKEFAKFPWQSNATFLTAWKEGRTGVPIVDAGMRELWATGYMHNRVRMIAASYLIKNLRIAWQEGEVWFWDTLIDADPANNAASWQWVAGSGADAAPFFRIFNPILQAERFDPDGAYIQKWVPELKGLTAPAVFAPWESPMECLAAGITLGETYPAPLVDLKETREAALAAYETIKKSS